MFAIRKEQIKALRDCLNEGVYDRIIQRLKEKFPNLVRRYTKEQLDDLYEDGMDRAPQFRFTNEKNVYIFIASTLVFGKDFDVNEKQQWSREVLGDPTLDEDLAARLLELRIYMRTGIQV